MHVRAYILCLLILSQPLSAFGAVWHSTASADTGDAMASHCDSESMPEHHQQPASDDASSDCIDACDSCAACALIMATDIAAEQSHARSENGLAPLLVMPPGQSRLVFRPPIQA
jgi:hypothetical protein